MAQRFELLVFDWDGTLMDSAAAIVGALQAACGDLNLPLPTDNQARQVIGLGLLEAMQALLPGLSPVVYAEMIERYRYHYLGRDQQLRLFTGIADLVADLFGAGYALAVATGKSRRGLDRALQLSGLEEYFTDSRCADECFSKPHPQMLEELMQAFAVRPTATLMIGDTTHDVQMAVNAGVAAVGVTYGAHAASELNALQPLACVDSVQNLRAWLQVYACPQIK